MTSKAEQWEEALSLCVRCGRCRSVCPTLQVLRQETSVARGRVVLTRHLTEGCRGSATAYEILHTCLLCMACEEVCTNKVPITEIVQRGRGLLRERGGSPRWKTALSWVLSHPKAMDFMAKTAGPLGLISPDGRTRGMLLRIPKLLEEGFFMPPIYTTPFRNSFRGIETGGSKGRALLFLGCLIDHSYPQIADATVRLLHRLGYSCIVPRDQFCCGHPHLAMGFRKEAESIIATNTELFSSTEADFILTACASCASTLKKEYDLPLPVLDVVELLQRHREDLYVSLPQGVKLATWHQPCHLGRGQGIDATELVQEILGEGFSPMENPDRCCGFGGTLSVEFSHLSSEVGREKAEWIRESGAELVLTDCPACIMQIQRSLLAQDLSINVSHLVTILS